MIAARLYLNSLSTPQMIWGQINLNLKEYNSNPMEMSSTFSIPDITDCWCQREETHNIFTNLPNVARNKSSIIPHGVGVETRLSLG